MAAGLLTGANAWADITETVVVNCDFNNSETLFTGASRMTVSNDNNVKFTCADNSQNGYSLATYDFSSAIGTDASAVKIEFLYWIPNQNAAYRRFFTVGQKDLRTGFGKTSYSTAGSMFAFGLARNSSQNYFSINGASTTAAADAAGKTLAEWARAEIYVDLSAKKVNYKITNVENTTTYYSADGVAFVDGSASTCNQLDFFDCQNNVVSYLDNLVITKYVDNSKVATTYTVKYQNASGTDLKDATSYDTFVGDSYTATSNDMATFYSSDKSKKYVYASGNAEKEATATATNNVITLVFNEYDKIAYEVTAKADDATLKTLTSGEAYTDGSTTVTWNKFINVDDQWYETTGSYGKTITAAGNTDVAYTPATISYFFEAENLNTSRSGFPTASGNSYSGGVARRNYASGQMWTSAIENGGIFTLTMPYSMANASQSTIVVKTRDAEGNYTETGLSLTTSAGGIFTGTITVPAGSSVAICNDVAYNSNILVDYLTLTPATVPAAIGSRGMATFSSTYALDFTDVTDVTAYVVTGEKDDMIIREPIAGKVAANTGLVLKSNNGGAVTVEIPAATEGTEYNATSTTKNYLVAVSEDTEVVKATTGTNYVLSVQSGKVVFAPIEDVSATVTAGKAYLAMPEGSNARMLYFDEGEATAIQAVESLTEQGQEVYNLQGQRVSQPTKGLYIVNGKKVIKK